MKKIRGIFLVLALSAIAVQSFSQTTVRMRQEAIGFWTIDDDTMHIVKADDIVKASVYCPSFATDSVHISGATHTIDGITSNGITIPPGEASMNIGFDYALIDTLTIDADDKAWIMLLIDR